MKVVIVGLTVYFTFYTHQNLLRNAGEDITEIRLNISTRGLKHFFFVGDLPVGVLNLYIFN